MQLFGFEIRRRPERDSIKSFTPEVKDDGAVVVAAGGSYGTYVDLDGTVRTEAELVSRYREMSLQPEIDKAINEVVNESIVVEEGKNTIEMVLEDLNVDEKIKDIMQQEFKNILDLLDFKTHGYDLFKRWYIDGRSYFHVVIDEKAPVEGIKELRYVDPRKIRKIREVAKKRDASSQATIQKTKNEYYLYNEKGLNYGNKVLSNTTATGIRISADSIIQVTSGLLDQNNVLGLSYLHPAIKPLNQLRALEDATLIYHLSRSPERRIFYIDVGNLPKMKAEQYLRDMMVKYKNKLVYDAATGEIRDDRKFMTMLEDFWLPRREGGKGTEIQTLQGGTALPDLLGSVEYFQDRLYRALQVPLTRLKPDNVYVLGRATEISRDEINFAKYIDRIRNKFSDLFLFALEKQLILKKIATPDDWDAIKKYIRFKYLRDNYFSELKEIEIQTERMQILNQLQGAIGKYYSNLWVRKNILKQTDEDIQENDAEIAQEFGMAQYHPEILQMEYEQSFQKENMKNQKKGTK